MFKIIGAASANDCSKKWVVYELRDTTTAAIIYIGVVELIDLFSFKDAKRNPAFDLDANYILNVLSFHDDRTTALKAHQAAMRGQPMPELNKTMYFNRRRVIICHETGEKFPTQAEACKMHRIDRGALNRHLNRFEGFNTVGGRTYGYLLDK